MLLVLTLKSNYELIVERLSTISSGDHKRQSVRLITPIFVDNWEQIVGAPLPKRRRSKEEWFEAILKLRLENHEPPIDCQEEFGASYPPEFCSVRCEEAKADDKR